MLSRSNLKAQEKKVKEADAFVDGADSKVSRTVGRPKQKRRKAGACYCLFDEV